MEEDELNWTRPQQIRYSVHNGGGAAGTTIAWRQNDSAGLLLFPPDGLCTALLSSTC